MIRLLTRFFDDIHRLANFITANPPQEVLVVLCNEDKELFKQWRRSGPRVKKETV